MTYGHICVGCKRYYDLGGMEDLPFSSLCEHCWRLVDAATLHQTRPDLLSQAHREKILEIVAAMRQYNLYVPKYLDRIVEYLEHEEVAWLDNRET